MPWDWSPKPPNPMLGSGGYPTEAKPVATLILPGNVEHKVLPVPNRRRWPGQCFHE